jgi:hypothetical protein
MDRFNRRALRYSACLFLLVTIAAWPSAGWSRPAKHACDVNALVRKLLQNWVDQLKQAWSQNNPDLIVKTYAVNGVLLPTCSKGPLTGRPAIRGYFANDFLPLKPEATFDWNNAKIGGDCAHAFASGLYDFDLTTATGKATAHARYTYVFTSTELIAQHHSSLVPMKPPQPQQECPSPPKPKP